MWELKYETFPSDVKPGHTWDRPFQENDRGVRLVFGGFGKHIENADVMFIYECGDLSFKVLASRKDPASSSITNRYIVRLGGTLDAISFRLGPGVITLDRGREIAIDIKGALLAWRLTDVMASSLECTPQASEVVFDMRGWTLWDPALEGVWP
jgi:hypothetical protein